LSSVHFNLLTYPRRRRLLFILCPVEAGYLLADIGAWE
jgi:hypothetical protein